MHEYLNRPKFLARAILKNAVKIGVIIRPNKCSNCKIRCKPRGHHSDYSKPLEVKWLCRNCHFKCQQFQKPFV